MTGSAEAAAVAPEMRPEGVGSRVLHGIFDRIVEPNDDGRAVGVLYPGMDDAIVYGDHSVENPPTMRIRDKKAALAIVGTTATRGPAKALGDGYMQGHFEVAQAASSSQEGDVAASGFESHLGADEEVSVSPTQALKNFYIALSAGTDTSSTVYQGAADVRGALHGIRRRANRFSEKWLGVPLMERNRPEAHYDVGDKIIEQFVDEETGAYSCAVWPDDPEACSDMSLAEAQRAKYDLVWRKADTQDGDHVLDIGCGDGQALIQAALKYEGLTGVGITRSEEQAEAARARIEELGLTDKITIKVQDYREFATEEENEQAFDRIISIGMFEHVGREEHSTYMGAVRKMLKEDGLSVLHTIIKNNNNPTNAWIRENIFPGGDLPTNARINDTAMRAGFVVVDQQDLTYDYEKTLDRWGENFEGNVDTIRTMLLESGRSEEEAEVEIRKWRNYLAGCSASFGVGKIGLTQAVISRTDNRSRPTKRGTRLDEFPVGDLPDAT